MTEVVSVCSLQWHKALRLRFGPREIACSHLKQNYILSTVTNQLSLKVMKTRKMSRKSDVQENFRNFWWSGPWQKM